MLIRWLCLCISISTIEAVTLYDSINCTESGMSGVRVTMSDQDFLTAYTSVFRMSDGSQITMGIGDVNATFFQTSLAYTHGLMKMVVSFPIFALSIFNAIC